MPIGHHYTADAYPGSREKMEIKTNNMCSWQDSVIKETNNAMIWMFLSLKFHAFKLISNVIALKWSHQGSNHTMKALPIFTCTLMKGAGGASVCPSCHWKTQKHYYPWNTEPLSHTELACALTLVFTDSRARQKISAVYKGPSERHFITASWTDQDRHNQITRK